MQSLSAFFENNMGWAIASVAAAIVVVAFVLGLLYRLLFGRRLRAAANGRSRQPRLGIVDAYDLDRQRQLVLVRRDNVEHLIMIGGPTDVVIESAIIRAQSAPMARDKEGSGPVIGTVGSASAPAAPQPTLPSPAPPAPPGRTEPPIGSPTAVRTEPALGIAMASPNVDRTPVDRGQSRPIAVPDPGAPAGPAPQQQPVRMPPRPAPLPPRQAPAGAPPTGASPTTPAGGATPNDRPVPARTPLPPRPPVTRPPLPPRPNLASTLPPRPPRPIPGRAEPPRPGVTSDDVFGTAPAGMDDANPRGGREPEATPVAPEPAVAPPKPIETLESLEEEMAKLLGRPTPRRDG